MKPIPLNAETEQIARSLVWFEPPEEALADPVRPCDDADPLARMRDSNVALTCAPHVFMFTT